MKRYDVQLGDTLQTIATRFKTTPQAILQHNPAVQGIAPTARLSPGLVLWIADANDHAPATLPPLTSQSYRPRLELADWSWRFAAICRLHAGPPVSPESHLSQ